MLKKALQGNRQPGNKQGEAEGRGLGRGNRPGAGPAGKCVCPACGYEVDHVPGQRCLDMTCPSCGKKMIRG